MAEQEILQLILSELKDLKSGQTRLEDGQTRLEERQTRLEERQTTLEGGFSKLGERQITLEKGQEQLRSDVQSMMEQQSEALNKKLNEEILGVKIMIENSVTKRIDTLFDGYKLNHEKQWELERRVEAIEERLGIAL